MDLEGICRYFTTCGACVTGGCFWEPSGSDCVQVEDEYGPETTVDCSFEEGLTSTTSYEVESSNSLPMEFTTGFEQPVSSTLSSSFMTESLDALTRTVSSSSVTETTDRTSSPFESTTASPVTFCSTFTPHYILALAVMTAVIFLCISILIVMCKLKKRSDLEFLLRHKPSENGLELSEMPCRSTRGSSCRNGGIKPLYYQRHYV